MLVSTIRYCYRLRKLIDDHGYINDDLRLFDGRYSNDDLRLFDGRCCCCCCCDKIYLSFKSLQIRLICFGLISLVENGFRSREIL